MRQFVRRRTGRQILHLLHGTKEKWRHLDEGYTGPSAGYDQFSIAVVCVDHVVTRLISLIPASCNRAEGITFRCDLSERAPDSVAAFLINAKLES